jgi:hypothetical protein
MSFKLFSSIASCWKNPVLCVELTIMTPADLVLNVLKVLKLTEGPTCKKPEITSSTRSLEFTAIHIDTYVVRRVSRYRRSSQSNQKMAHAYHRNI